MSHFRGHNLHVCTPVHEDASVCLHAHSWLRARMRSAKICVAQVNMYPSKLVPRDVSIVRYIRDFKNIERLFFIYYSTGRLRQDEGV